MVEFARLGNFFHQRFCFGRNAKSKFGKPRRKTCAAQHAHRVFHECITDVAQQPRIEIRHTIVWINQLAVGIQGNRIDGEIATCEILFKRDIWRGVKHKTLIARRGFSLGAGQCIFSVGVWMEKYWKVRADGLIA